MKYIINNVGKGSKRSLKHIIIVDKTINKEQVIYDRVAIESRLIEQSLYHFKKVHSTRVYNNRIYYKLVKDGTRNKILNGILLIKECDNKDIY